MQNALVDSDGGASRCFNPVDDLRLRRRLIADQGFGFGQRRIVLAGAAVEVDQHQADGTLDRCILHFRQEPLEIVDAGLRAAGSQEFVGGEDGADAGQRGVFRQLAVALHELHVPALRIGRRGAEVRRAAGAARAHAFIEGRTYVNPHDVKAMAMDVLRHRVAVTYEAEAEGLSSETLVQRILDELPVP